MGGEAFLMPQPYDYLGLMGGAANIGGVNAGVQQALLGQQQIQQNQGILDQQTRENAARQAAATIASTPHIDDAQFEQLLKSIAQADPNAAVQMRRTRAIQQGSAELMKNPTAQNIGRFGMAYPEALKPLEDAWKVMDAGQREAATKTSADVYGYLHAGDSNGAIKILQQHMDAAGQTGEDVSAYPQLIETIRSNPKGALALAGLNLSLGMGHDKFADTYGKLGDEGRATEVQPYKVAEAKATASIKGTEARYAPQTAQSALDTATAQRQRMAAQTANEIVQNNISQGRLALDQNKLEADVQLHLADLDQKNGQLTPGSEKIVNEAAGEAAAKQQIADQERNLAARIRASGMHAFGNFTERTKAIWGGQDQYTQLRAEYAQMRNQGALANRANMPGAMSDADREFLLQGFPSLDADPAYVARFLDVMAKAHEAVARQADNKATWAASNGNLGPAKRPFVIDGYRIPKGMTFAQHQAALAKIAAPALPPEADAVVTRARGQ